MAESGFHFWRHSKLQAVADAAAFAGAVESRSGSAGALVTTAATNSAVTNGWAPASGAIEVDTPPSTGTHQTREAVEVRITEQLPRFFTAMFSQQPMIARARAVAVYQTVSNACVLALSPNARQALQVQGSSRLELDGCDVVSNSLADDALQVWGAGRLTADCAVSAGGVASKNGLQLNKCSAPVTQAPRVGDPLRDLPDPTPGPSQSVPKNSNEPITLLPGRYSGGMDLKGNVTLQPGAYYISGGNFTVNANAAVSGSGVTIYMESGSNIRMNGSATVSMSAPTTGAYSGVLFFGDRDGGGDNVFNGNASSALTGNIYFPSQQVSFNGSFSGDGGCVHIIANTVDWGGDAELKADCDAKGMSRIPSRQAVRVVE
ncbi:hypothetical protein [Phenylobacterium sp. LjRoot225]|uniref:hypothetical protein n=1 Tax=Phenylobacterium sp. LjRoot225 TaxID=3342285 RepID=UPI003F503236